MYVHKAAVREDRASAKKENRAKSKIGIDREREEEENWWLQPTGAGVKKKKSPLKNEDKQSELGWL